MVFTPIDFPFIRRPCFQQIILFEGDYCIERTKHWYILGYDPISKQDPVRGVVYSYLTARRVLACWPWSDLRQAWRDALACTFHPARYRGRFMMMMALTRGKMTTAETRRELADHAQMKQEAEDRRAKPRVPKPI